MVLIMADNLEQLAYLLVDATNRHRQWMDILTFGELDSREDVLRAVDRAHYYGDLAAKLRAQIINQVMDDNGYVMVYGRYLENDKP